MRAAVVKEFGDPEVIKLSNLPIPNLETSSQVLVRVGASGVNPIDTYIREGQFDSSLPYTPGKDGAGVVVKVGAKVHDVKKGDRVYFAFAVTGSAAEYCIADRVFPLPPSISLEEGACLGIPYMTAYRALFLLGKIQEGQNVLVHGASGGVGLAAVQMAAEQGITVVGTASTDEGLELVKQNGASDVFNHKAKGHIKEIMKKYPEGFNLIVEMAANVNLPSDLDLLCRNGKVIVVGSHGPTKIYPGALMGNESRIIGISLARSTPDEWEEMSSFIYKFLSTSRFRPVIARTYSLDSVGEAHRDIMAGKGARGKLIVSINENL